MKDIIDKHWYLIEKSRFGSLFNEKPLIAYRRNKNISDTLVRAKCNDIQVTTTIKSFIPPCKTPWKCNFCPKHRDRDTNTYKSRVRD
jgi:hypothetical protein